MYWRSATKTLPNFCEFFIIFLDCSLHCLSCSNTTYCNECSNGSYMTSFGLCER